jgi:DNA-directed RNA polymerase subunit beta'
MTIMVTMKQTIQRRRSAMNKHQNYGTTIADFDAVRLAVAAPEDILNWSNGEVIKPETINYRTQKPERDGLFCEKIFGPVKDINPHDAKYKGMRSREMATDKKGEIVTKSIVRRERMAHISLAAPVAHIWFLRGTPSAIGLLLGMTVKNLERITYFASYVVKSVNAEKRDQMIADLEAEAVAAKKAIEARYEEMAKDEKADIKALAAARNKEIDEAGAKYSEQKDQLDSLVKYGLMSETDYRELTDSMKEIVEVGMGGQALKELLEEINVAELIKELNEESEKAKGQRRKKLMKRLKVIESMDQAGIKPSSMMVSVLPVIPPDLRPMVQLTGGRFATSDLNDLYRRVINRNNRLKKLIDLNAPEVIRRNEMRMLQEAVDALIDNNNARSGRAVSATGGRRRLKSLSDMLKGKQGRFRQNLLGKRVDYSGRSVIVSGPELSIHECGLPKMMALELFKPFVIGYLIQNDHAHNIKSATRMIESADTIVWDALDEVIKGKYVLLNRAPTLHRLGIQSFQPRLIEGKAIQLHPLVCKGFNADFDGDQMAVHLPLSTAAQKEAREIMSAAKNLLKPADGTPILHIEQDIVLGLFYLTYQKPAYNNPEPQNFSSLEEAIHAYDQDVIKLQSNIKLPIKGEVRETTIGRVFFNEALPNDFAYQNDPMTKKKLSGVMSQIYEQFGQAVTAEIGDKIKDIGFEYATSSGLSTGMDDYTDVEVLDSILEEGEKRAADISDQYEQGLINNTERYRLTVECWRDVDQKVLKALESQFAQEDTTTSVAVVSGARGNIGQVKQITGSIGILADATGREIELPIKSNYKSGMTPLEYFTSTRGTRKGMISTALKTADSGYLTRRLVDVSQDVFVTNDDYEDPGFAVSKSETAEIGLDFAERITGRFSAEIVKIDGKKVVGKSELITQEIAEQIKASDLQEIKIMSVLSCTNLRGVSQKSYGVDMSTGEVVEPFTPIGVIAAQSIGEPGTQLTLDVFHSGGVAGDDISQGLPRVEELFEARAPKGEAFISEISGTVSLWEEGDTYLVQVASDSKAVKTVKLKGAAPKVKSGASVAVGDVIASDKDGKKPVTAPIDGVIEFGDDQAMISPSDKPFVRYEIPGYKTMVVADGDVIEAGDRLTSGSINLQELMRLKGVEATQRYIMNDVLKMFASQGQTISDKHLEVVVRQMFSRVSIEDSGDTTFVTGDVVSRAAVEEANKQMLADKKEPAVFNQLLLGITKVSTWSDSFLSAASFQDTTRVLISAATSGKVDNLYGLKENVILGRRIPVGTGAVIEEPELTPEATSV